jgi:hypothetical protein
MKSKPVSFVELQRDRRAREQLVEMGLVQDSGRRRNGQIVWEIMTLGKVYAGRENEHPH